MSLKLKDIVRKFDLEIVYKSTDYENIIIDNSEMNRPGLQLCGYFNKFIEKRIQFIGTQEWYYLNSLSEKKRFESLKSLFQYDIPCIIFTRQNTVCEEAIELAQKYDISILKNYEQTSKIMSKITTYIDEELAPSTRLHGVLLDVYGVGVLIKGRSGIGKSETALDLISQGSRLISDDSVIVKKIDNNLRGTSPEITKHFMEIRGVGIIDVQKMFGVGFVMEEKNIDMIVNLEDWDESKEYDRLGLEDKFEKILGLDVVAYNVPVKPGRHTALIIDVATKNYKQKELGYNPAEVLNDRIIKNIKNNR